MKIQIDKGTGNFANFQTDDYTSNDNFIQINSYASDIDMKDVETNQAWKFKIDDKGHLSYDLDKILEKENNDIVKARQAKYRLLIDDKVIEKICLNFPELFTEENAIRESIKLEFPKKEVK